MKATFTTSVLLACALFSGAAAIPRSVRAKFPLNSASVVEKPDRMTLYSLAPEQLRAKGPTFHNWPVVKQKEITDAKTRKQLTGALFQAMASQKDGALCFVPHHGLRVARGKKTVDLVLCFTCQWVDIYHGGKTKRAPLSAKPMALYDQALGPIR